MGRSVTRAAPICRDCLTFAPANAARCPQCGSPRLLLHPERDELAIAHIDCDAFYAAVEKRDNPELHTRPLIIGGGRRGVVSTCCYIARTYGVRSAMPMFQALKLCPKAVVIAPDMQKYAQVGRQVRDKMLELTPLVEPISIDEAFLDLSGTQILHGASPALTLARFALEVQSQLGISVSIGLSYCKFLAKVASDYDKPRGFTILGRAEAPEFLKSKDVSLIWGVGKVMQARLQKAGYTTIGDLQNAEPRDLAKAFGDEGLRLARLARGEDNRRVHVEHETKGISAETTFFQDLSTDAEIAPVLLKLCERVALRLKKAELCGAGITLKLKTREFQLKTRATTLPPTQLSNRIFNAARHLLQAELGTHHYRLIGVGITHLMPADAADHADLIDHDLPREKAREAALDQLRAKFGQGSISRGLTFAPHPKTKPEGKTKP